MFWSSFLLCVHTGHFWVSVPHIILTFPNTNICFSFISYYFARWISYITLKVERHGCQWWHWINMEGSRYGSFQGKIWVSAGKETKIMKTTEKIPFPEYLEPETSEICRSANYNTMVLRKTCYCWSFPKICTTKMQNSLNQQLTALGFTMYLLSHNNVCHKFFLWEILTD